MDENVQKLRVGFYTLVVMFILAILIFLNSEGWGSNYSVTIKTTNAPGVRIGTPVRKTGILIGRVADVAIQDDYVVLQMAIKDSVRIYANETVSIGAESILGDAGLEVVPLPSEERGEMVIDGQEMFKIVVKPGMDDLVQNFSEMGPVIEGALESIKASSVAVEDAGVGVKQLTDTLNGALTDENSDLKLLIADIRRLSTKAESAVDNVDGMFEQVLTYIEDPDFQENFDEFVRALPGIFKEIQITVADTRKVINSFGGVGSKVESVVDGLGAFTEKLEGTGPEILDQVNDGLKDIRGLVKNAEGFGETLAKLQETFQNQEGTVGKLFNESELYDEVLKAVKDIKEISANVRRVSVKLEPLMNDARVITDKVARDPGGVLRGALQKKPVGSGYKGTPGNRGILR